MDEKRLHEQVTQAVQGHCRRLQPDPFLAQRVLHAATKKESVQVKKTHVGLILAIVLMMLSVSAVAVALLTGMEIVEQNAVPMAQGNDEGAVRPNMDYSAEELQALIRVAAENGITLDDDTSIMQALRSGEGYSEEETIMELCREAFGGLFYEWTVEQKHWFQEMMIAIGWSSQNPYMLPGEGDMTSEAARQLARETVLKHYPDAAINDPALYRMEEEFSPYNGQTDAAWFFHFYPKTLEGVAYHVYTDRVGQWVEVHADAPSLAENYTEKDLLRAIQNTYAYRNSSQVTWTAEIWVKYRELLPNAQHSENWGMEHEAYLMTTYALPEAGDMDKSALREIVLPRLGDKSSDMLDAAVLLDVDGRHIWRVTTHTVDENDERDGWVYLEVDAKTGEIISEVSQDYYRPNWAEYVPESVFQELFKMEMSADEAISIASKALHKELGDDTIPYQNESWYKTTAQFLDYSGEWHITFKPLNMLYGNAAVEVNAETHEVDIHRADAPGINADTLRTRYNTFYNWDWVDDPAMWAQFSAEIQQLPEAETFDGRLYQITPYIDDADVAISLDKACDIAVLDAGDTTLSIIRCILIDAEPNPIWKLRVSTWPLERLYEIDAMTGEVLDVEMYACQMENVFDHDMKAYTLRSTFMPLYLQEYGAARVAWEYCYKQNYDHFQSLALYEETYLNEQLYYIVEDGLTVTFAAMDPTYVCGSWRVTLAEDVMSAEVVRLSPREAEEILDQAPEGSRPWLISTYGEDPMYWPMAYWQDADMPGEGNVPGEGDMTEEEAIALAVQLVKEQQGVTVDPAQCRIGRLFTRVDEHLTVWEIILVGKDGGELQAGNGWDVTIHVKDGQLVPESCFATDLVGHLGTMTEEDAITHAKQKLIAQIGQDAYDALGEVEIIVTCDIFENGGTVHRWTVKFVSKASLESADGLLVGWRVVFALRDGETWGGGDIKDINDNGNG